MQITQYGPGDPQVWGPILSPLDPRADSITDEEAFDAAVSTICAQRIKSAQHIAEARESLPAVTAAAVDSAIADALAAKRFGRMPPEKLALIGLLIAEGAEKEILRDAAREVRRDFEQQAREAEEDAARERMEV